MSSTPEQPPAELGTSIAALFSELGILGFLQPGIVKAISHLIYGVTDIPVAYLEGFADSIRSTTEARRHLRLEAARSIATEFKTNSELAARAYAQHATKILKEQVIVEDVLGIAIEQLSKSEATTEPQGVPNDDWLAALRAEAAQRSSDEMKLAFGKILAGEIESPGTYSIRTVRALGMMETRTASLFKRFCNLVLFVHPIDARVIVPSGNAAHNALHEFGLPFSQLNVLQENGLVISDFNSWLEYSQLTEIPVPMTYAGWRVRLTQMEGIGKEVKLHGVALTNMGTELYSVVDLEENPDYSKKLIECFRNNNIVLRKFR